MEKTWLTVDDISKGLKVHPQTVRRWLRMGELHGVLMGDKAGYRIHPDDLDTFLRQRGYSPQPGRADLEVDDEEVSQ